MIDVQDLYGIRFDAIDDEVGQTWNNKLPRSLFTPDTATMAQGAESCDGRIDFPEGCLGKGGKVPGEVIRDGFQVIGRTRGPAKAH
jgi:hypothetical protein